MQAIGGKAPEKTGAVQKLCHIGRRIARLRFLLWLIGKVPLVPQFQPFVPICSRGWGLSLKIALCSPTDSAFRTLHGYLSPGAKEKSRRDFGPKPRVARNELPWVCGGVSIQP